MLQFRNICYYYYHLQVKVTGPYDLMKTVKRQKLFVDVKPKPGTSKEGNNKFHMAGVEYNSLCVSCPAAFKMQTTEANMQLRVKD